MFEAKKDYYAAVAKRFQAYQSGGMNVTQATKRLMEEFGIMTPATVFNIRRTLAGATILSRRLFKLRGNTMITDSLVMNDSFYLDNDPLDEKQIRLTFKDAVTKALEANCLKPQTRQCVLRAPSGVPRSRHGAVNATVPSRQRVKQ